MTRRRGCLIAVSSLLGLCLIACVLGWFVGIPRLRDAIKDDVEGAVGTEVARRLAPAGGTPAPGTYVITEQDLTERLRAESDEDTQDVEVRIDPVGIEVVLPTEGQEFTYSGRPTAEDGRLVVRGMEANNDAIEFFFPPDDVAEAIEDGVNDYLAANALRLAALELGEGQMTLTTEPAG
jgi:hypothetical protein